MFFIWGGAEFCTLGTREGVPIDKRVCIVLVEGRKAKANGRAGIQAGKATKPLKK